MVKAVNWLLTCHNNKLFFRLKLRQCFVGEGVRNLNLSSNIMSQDQTLTPPDAVRGKVSKAGVIIIGDEVLKGHVKDENSYFLCQRFHALGVRLAKISTLPDSIVDIANEVRTFSDKYDVVVTTGGIGPTHDDLTYEGVCEAFGDKMVKNEHLFKFWSRIYPPASADKMARVPSTADLIYAKVRISEGGVPIVRMRNVYVFPGIPTYLKLGFSALEREHFSGNGSFHWRNLYLLVDESVAVEALESTVAAFPHVEIGSYPEVVNRDYATRIVLEGRDKSAVIAAEEHLRNLLEDGWEASKVVGWRAAAPAALNQFRASIAGQPFSANLSTAINVVDKCMTQYGSKGVFVCFNGGKDCTALIHLAHCRYYPVKLHGVYIRGKNPFPEMESFIQETAHRYGMHLTIEEGPIKPALEKLLQENPDWKAVLMGTRRTDPNAASMDHFQMTDPGWPRVMRVNPMLDWDYGDVWHFLRELKVPYCSLYDEGYTSIGGRDNTFRNSKLAYEENGQTLYHPAYMLAHHSSERLGRPNR